MSFIMHAQECCTMSFSIGIAELHAVSGDFGLCTVIALRKIVMGSSQERGKREVQLSRCRCACGLVTSVLSLIPT